MIFLAIWVVFVLIPCIYMMCRNCWVYNNYTERSYSCTEEEYNRYWDYDKMMLRFWIWDFERMKD